MKVEKQERKKKQKEDELGEEEHAQEHVHPCEF